MGRRGPKPTPTVVLKLRGSKDVVGRRSGEVSPPPGTPDAPVWLSDVERTVWDETVAELSLTPGLLAKVDRGLLSCYCEAWGEFFAAREEIRKFGATVRNDKGGECPAAAVGRKNKGLERIIKIGAAFGMSPADRSSVKITPVTTAAGKKRFFA